MKNYQNGNALFLILIAVALFAALSYAITQSGRGGGSISKEQAVIAASQVTQYAASVHTAVQRMIIGGITPSSICYGGSYNGNSLCSAPEQNRVFDQSGGGVIFQCASETQVDLTYCCGDTVVTNWRFRGIHRTNDKGFYIKDVGTNTNVSGRDAFAYLASVKPAVCQQINKGLGLDPTPVDDTAFSYNMGADTYNTGGNTITAYPGQPFACIGEDALSYPSNYYHALIEQ